MKKLFFLSGLPRSGSTILGSILNQNPLLYVTPTSPLGDLLFDIDAKLNHFNVQYSFDFEKVSYNIYKSISSNFYNHRNETYIFDKNRTWPQNIDAIRKFIDNDPKIIAVYRPIPDIISSYITLINKSKNTLNFIDNYLRNNNLELNVDNRAEFIWKQCVSPSYESLVIGITKYPEFIHLVNYDTLVNNPKEELKKLYLFLNLNSYKHNFNSIENTCGQEKDDEWGLEGLHNTRKILSKESETPINVIGHDNVKLYSEFNLEVN